MTRNEILRYIFWEWIEPIGSALGIALLVMKFVMALYVIPTGSMQPTLHGKGDYPSELGDKVLVNKFIYRFQKPERWDVIVFQFPYISVKCETCGQDLQDVLVETKKEAYEKASCSTCFGQEKNFSFMHKDYIKRCVAVPGDEISVRDGNIVLKQDGKWTPSVKTELAQDALWQTVFDSRNQGHMSVFDRFWQTGPLLAGWRHGQPLQFSAGSEQIMLFNDRDLLRGYGDKGQRGGPVPINAPYVGDIKISLELDLIPSNGLLELEITRNFIPYILQVDFSNQKMRVKVSDKVISELKLKSVKNLSFSRLDGQLWVRQGDDVVNLVIPNFDVEKETTQIMPKIRYKGDKFSIPHIKLYRDIYYQGGSTKFFTGPEKSYKVMPGEYFAMGDNSYFSYDGRSWGAVPQERLIGKALTVLLPFSRMKLIY